MTTLVDTFLPALRQKYLILILNNQVTTDSIKIVYHPTYTTDLRLSFSTAWTEKQEVVNLVQKMSVLQQMKAYLKCKVGIIVTLSTLNIRHALVPIGPSLTTLVSISLLYSGSILHGIGLHYPQLTSRDLDLL